MDSFNEILDTWQVHEPGDWQNDTGPEGWYAVSNDNGIVAYFGRESDAYRFRWNEICCGICRDLDS